jgi:dipeptide/tripeptide permease
MSGVIGGWVADRLLGSRRSIFAGGVPIMAGGVCLSVPGGGLVAVVGDDPPGARRVRVPDDVAVVSQRRCDARGFRTDRAGLPTVH